MEAAARHVASVPGAAKTAALQEQRRRQGPRTVPTRNYLMSRRTPFSAVISGLTPFMVSRQVVTGSGRVGIGPSGDDPGFQLSQRAGLHRGRGRPGDHPQARDHQHPRRGRTPTPTSTAGCTSSSGCQPGRDVDPPQGGHHLAGARPDRGGRELGLDLSDLALARPGTPCTSSAGIPRCAPPSHSPTDRE